MQASSRLLRLLRLLPTLGLLGALAWLGSEVSPACARAVRPPAPAAHLERVPDEFAPVQWESPHVHPLEISADGRRLYAVNTPDHRLEVLRVQDDGLSIERSIPVGLEPVTVRLESPDRAWVVNHVSDSVSVIDLDLGTVVATLRTEDEPCDVVFAGQPRRAFVSCSQANSVLVFDPASPRSAPERLAIDGEGPRGLAVSPDGRTVYVAIFASGNRSTILGGGSLFNIDFPPNVVGRSIGPYSGRNPPPNSRREGGFDPPLSPGLPSPPAVGLIVKRNAKGEWRDDFLGDWTHLVSGPSAGLSGRVEGWDLTDHDLAIVDAERRSVRYVRGLMNTCMALAVHPESGAVTVVGTDATNEVRFEPVLRGRFLRVLAARVEPSGDASEIVDLNPQLDYARHAIPATERSASIGDPRALAWSPGGEVGFVCGLGSNNVVAIDAAGRRLDGRAPLRAPEGPTGLALDAERGRLYVLGKHASAVSAIDLETGFECARASLFDPTPVAVRRGRAVLYGTHEHSGLGHIACASCHVDTRSDHLAWDLGDPSGAAGSLEDRNLGAQHDKLIESRVPGRGGFEPYHPMKGPMTTQPLPDVIGKEPLHWRGDRGGLEDFRGAFVTLQGADAPPSDLELDDLKAFLASISYPPNPYRALDNSLPSHLPLPGHVATGRFGPAGVPLPAGNARRGLERFRTGKLDNLAVDCVTCHTLPTGYGPDALLTGDEAKVYEPIAAGAGGRRHHMLVAQDGSTNVTMKVPQLRGLYDKVGFDCGAPRSHFGFGFLHDGSVDTLARFVGEQSFTLESDQDTADMVAFLLAFTGSDLPWGRADTPLEPPGTASKDTHAAVGRQITLTSSSTSAQFEEAAALRALAATGRVDLVVRGVVQGRARGFLLTAADHFQSDRERERTTWSQLEERVRARVSLTLTLVPAGRGRRIGLDRDGDGVLDGDEPGSLADR